MIGLTVLNYTVGSNNQGTIFFDGLGSGGSRRTSGDLVLVVPVTGELVVDTDVGWGVSPPRARQYRDAWRDTGARIFATVLGWDGGKSFPYGGTAVIDPTTTHGAQWAARLEPIGRTGAFAKLQLPEDQTLTDPLTQLPAVPHPNGTIITAPAQRLITTSPLDQVILDQGHVWIRTRDGTLYLPPRRHSGHLGWGNSGPYSSALAALIDRLLTDITAPSVENHQARHELIQRRWPVGTVLTRAQLEATRYDRPYPTT